MIAGETGGVSGILGWSGGGAFHFYKLDRQGDRSKIAGLKKKRITTAKAKRRKS